MDSIANQLPLWVMRQEAREQELLLEAHKNPRGRQMKKKQEATSSSAGAKDLRLCRGTEFYQNEMELFTLKEWQQWSLSHFTPKWFWQEFSWILQQVVARHWAVTCD